MNRLSILHRAFFFAFLLVCTTVAAQQRFQFTEPKMGSPFNLIFYTSKDSATVTALAEASFRLVDSLNDSFSDYKESSELNALSRTAGSGKGVKVSPLLYDILLQSKRAAQKSERAFDVTVGPLSKLWRAARKSKTFPSADEVLEVKKKVGNSKLQIDTNTKEIKLLSPGMQLDLGGIAKGYAAQKVIDFLKENGIESALADAGGDLVCSNPPPGKKGWTIGINVPENETELLDKTIVIKNEAVATSGDVYQYIEHDGKRYSHIIDPRTGYGVSFQRNVTVLAKDGATSDWLATACSILPLSKCKALGKRLGAELLITQLQKGKVSYFMTDGMKQRLKDTNPQRFPYFSER